jgi:class 3 adenylate cyclase/tetratricopeptide (TPR) repeat protein
MKCDTCGSQNVEDALRCCACNRSFRTIADEAPVERAPPGRVSSAERRQVTAVFCDLVDSVSLTERLDPEDMAQVIDVYLSACDDIIARYGGTITQYMGDGVLAYFGYPRASEHDAANAVRASIDLRDAVTRLALVPGIRLQLRIGIATGLVVIDDLVGRGKGRQNIVGETPNLAARLQSVAARDRIMVARTTQRITRGLFSYRDLQTFTLKGFTRPVEASEVVEAVAIDNRFLARAEGKAPPLVGRERELALIQDCWVLARAGQGRVILLQGEAGIGKSRLVEAARRHAADTAHTETAWYCGPHQNDSALRPITQQLARAAGFDGGDDAASRTEKLRRLLARSGADETANLAATLAVLADLFGIPPRSGAPDEVMTPDRRKAVTLDTLLALLDRAAHKAPALFIFEDAHWSDSTSLELLDRAIGTASARAWLIIVTARPDYQPAWLRRDHVVHIRLGRLTRGDAERICVNLGAEAMLPSGTLRQIVDRCDGIPLFVEEMTKSVLEATAAAPTQDGVPVVAIPESLKDSLVARLDRLGPARRIANLGAVIGRRFSYALLAAVANQPEAVLRRMLRELTLSGLVERSGLAPASSYLFKHALIRDAAYDSLLKRERQLLHGQIAAALRDRFPQIGQTEPDLLAYHLTEAGAIADAIPLRAEAGRRAASRAAHVEAVGHLQTACDLLRRLPKDDALLGTELQVLIGLAVSLAASRGYSVPEVERVLAEARAICDRLGNDAALFAVLRGICALSIVACELDSAEATARRCAEISERTGLVEHRIESDCPLGYVLWAKGDLPRARQHLERAVGLYRDHGGARLPVITPQDPLIQSLGPLLLVLSAMGDDDAAERAADALIVHGRSLGGHFNLACALFWQALYFILRSDFARALAPAEEALGLCDRYGYPTFGALAFLFRAYCIGHRGDLDQALDMAHAGIAELDRLGIRHGRSQQLGEIASLHAAAGDLPTALHTIDAAIAEARRSGEAFFLAPLLRRRAEFLAQHPGTSPASVTAALREALAVAEAQGATGFARQAAARLDDDTPFGRSEPIAAANVN